jgi:hypothetical protein
MLNKVVLALVVAIALFVAWLELRAAFGKPRNDVLEGIF